MPNPILRTLTQQLSEVRATALQVGIVDKSGFYGSLYGFNGAKNVDRTHRDRINSGGVAIGYQNLNHPVGVDIGVGYLNNMANVGAIKRDLPGKYYQDHRYPVNLW